MAKKITWEDKEHILPYGTRENQVWDLDMNEIKTVVNANADSLAGLEGGYQGVLLIADTPVNDGYYIAGESGTYTNAGGLVVDLTNTIVFINKVGAVFTTTEITITPYVNDGVFDDTDNVFPATQKSTSDYIGSRVNGIVESGNVDAVSGDVVYENQYKKIEDKPKEDIKSTTTGKYWNVVSGNIVQSTSSSFTLIDDVYNVVGKKYVLLKNIPTTISSSSLLGVLTAGGINTTISKTSTPLYNNVATDKLIILPANAEEVRISFRNEDLETAEVYLCEYEPEDFINSTVVTKDSFNAEIYKRLKETNKNILLNENLYNNSIIKNLVEDVEIKRGYKILNAGFVLDYDNLCTDYIPIDSRYPMLYVQDYSKVDFITLFDENKTYIDVLSNASEVKVLPDGTSACILNSNVRFIVVNYFNNYTDYRDNGKISFFPINSDIDYLLSENNLGNGIVSNKDFKETYQVDNLSIIDGHYYIPSGNNVVFSTNVNLCSLVTSEVVVGRKSVVITGVQDTRDNYTSLTYIARVILEDDTLINVKPTYDCTEFGVDGFKYNLPSNVKKIYFFVNQADSATVKMYLSNSDTITEIDTEKASPQTLGQVKLLNGKVWNSEGDSITFRELWQPYVVEQTGAILTNTGIGSTKLAGTGGVGFESFWETVRINAVKANNPDILTIMGGTNDWAADIPIGNESDMLAFTTSTFKGAYGYLIDAYLTWKPTLKLILMTPMYNGGATNLNGDTIYEYAKATKEVADYYGLPFVDTLGLMGVNSYNINTYTSDGVHPNDEGARRMANITIAEFIKNIYN
jgi:lysophospholipase L1-like esterase